MEEKAPLRRGFFAFKALAQRYGWVPVRAAFQGDFTLEITGKVTIKALQQPLGDCIVGAFGWFGRAGSLFVLLQTIELAATCLDDFP